VVVKADVDSQCSAPPSLSARGTPKTKAAFRLDGDDLAMLAAYAAHHGLRTRTDAVRMLIRAGYRRIDRAAQGQESRR
jgi:hypothetical protein